MLQANLEGRILPQLFTGGMITSNEINGLTATLGHIDRVNQRASTNRERMEMNVLGKGLVDKKQASQLPVRLAVTTPVTRLTWLT